MKKIIRTLLNLKKNEQSMYAPFAYIGTEPVRSILGSDTSPKENRPRSKSNNNSL